MCHRVRASATKTTEYSILLDVIVNTLMAVRYIAHIHDYIFHICSYNLNTVDIVNTPGIVQERRDCTALSNIQIIDLASAVLRN